MQVRHIKIIEQRALFYTTFGFTRALAIDAYLNLASGACGGVGDTISTTLVFGLVDANCNPFLTTFHSISTPIRVSISLSQLITLRVSSQPVRFFFKLERQ